MRLPESAFRGRARRGALALAAAAALIAAAGCGGSGGSGGSSGGTSGGSKSGGSDAAKPTVQLPSLKGQKLTVAAIWTGAEQKNFRSVAAEFEKRTGAKITFTPTGDNVSNYLGTKVAGKQPPDVAFLPQVGVLKQFAKSKWIFPLSSSTTAQLAKNYSATWRDLGADGGKQYGVYFKVSNKSTVWYNTKVFATAGVTPPATWAAFTKAAQTVFESGTPALSIGASDGWTLTDWFENVYLSQAGPEKYDALAQHKIPWTDPSVAKALKTLGALWGKKGMVYGGAKGALGTDFPGSVTQAFSSPPKAGMTYEGDFTTINIASQTKAKVGTDAKFFPFPAVDGGKAPVVSGGDVGVKMKNTKAADALLTFCASPDAARIWAAGGGFFSPNRHVPMSAWPDSVSRGIEKSLLAAGDSVRFDMSDQAPAAFGGTKGQGEWKDLQDFLAHPADVAGTQKQLEADAKKAYANAG